MNSEISHLLSFYDYSKEGNGVENIWKKLDDSEGHDSNRNHSWKHVELILQGIDMDKHSEKFKSLNISLDTFLRLNDADLIAAGITDENDRKIILQNLSIHRKSSEEYLVLENLEDDLIIADNVYKQLVLLQKYSALLEFKLKNEKLIDYEGDKSYPPSRWLKIFLEAALVQCDNMSNLLYNDNDSDHTIGKLLKAHDLELTKHMEEKLIGRRKILGKFWTKIILVGIPLIAIVTTARYLCRGIKF